MSADDIKLGQLAVDMPLASATAVLMVRDSEGVVFTFYIRSSDLTREGMVTAIESLWRTVTLTTAKL